MRHKLLLAVIAVSSLLTAWDTYPTLFSPNRISSRKQSLQQAFPETN